MKTEKQTHTPLPWKIGGDGASIEKSGKLLASAWFPWRVDETRLEGESWLDMRRRTDADRQRMVDEQFANADLICRAVNSHYDLIEALNYCAIMLSDFEATGDEDAKRGYEMAIQALAKAKGEA